MPTAFSAELLGARLRGRRHHVRERTNIEDRKALGGGEVGAGNHPTPDDAYPYPSHVASRSDIFSGVAAVSKRPAVVAGQPRREPERHFHRFEENETRPCAGAAKGRRPTPSAAPGRLRRRAAG